MTTRTRHDAVYRAISEPTRRRIVDLLAERERSVKELVPRFRMSQPALSQHLRVLRDAGLVRVRRQGRMRYYVLDAGPLRAVRDWVATTTAAGRGKSRGGDGFLPPSPTR